MIPKVSVIIPCYNYEKYIEQCLMSILLQRLDYPIEIILSDDNSSDNSYAIANRIKINYESDKFIFKLFKQEQNLKEISNTKFLLEKSTGEYISYIDADDYWTDPYKLQKQIEFMDSNPDYSMCITGYLTLENDEYIPSPHFINWFCPPIDINSLNSDNLTRENIVGASSSRLFRNYGNMVEDYFYEFPYSDWLINFELSFRGKIKYLDFPAYVYRIHNKSLSVEKEKETDTQEDAIILHNKRIGILRDVLNKKLYSQ
jgi:glycosyltransferase involved in cell wall biosynthesis